MELLALFLSVFVASASGFRIVCYFNNGAQYRRGIARFIPKNVNPNLCTHIVYGYAKIENLSLKAKEWNDESTPWSQGMYELVVNLKKNNTNLKVLLAVGDCESGYDPFASLLTDTGMQRTFAKNAVQYLRKRKFDGIHVDKIYKGARSRRNDEKRMFNLLMQELRKAFQNDAKATGVPRLILAASVPAEKVKIDNRFDVRVLARIVDFMSLRTLDFHTGSERKTGLSSPLYASQTERGEERQLNVDWVANYYVTLGAPPEKINIGIPTYARSFTLVKPKLNGIGSPVKGHGYAGSLTSRPGIMGYFEVCHLNTPRATIQNVRSQASSYMSRDIQWISYQDVKSMIHKACYVKKNRYGGVTIWSLDLDDFTGQGCSQGAYPLIEAVRGVFQTSKIDCTRLNTQATKGLPVIKERNSQLQGSHYIEYPVDRVVCYYTNWSQYRKDYGQFFPEHIDPNLCTHVVYAYANITGTTLGPSQLNDESTGQTTGLYQRVINLKTINPSLKVLLAIGGEKVLSKPFKPIVTTAENRLTFARNVAQYLRQREFDGLEMSWQYPSSEYRNMYTQLMKDLRLVFDTESRSSNKPRLLLTAALPVDKDRIDNGYNIPSLVTFTDFVTIMAYEFHERRNKVLSLKAPLYGHPEDVGAEKYCNVDWFCQYYVQLGVPRQQITLGIPTYGRSFRLWNPMHNWVGSLAFGRGEAGAITGLIGMLSYYEVCEFINEGATVEVAYPQGTPFAFRGHQWVSYDDTNSVIQKACYAKDNQFGGVAIMSLDYDDFTGQSCHRGRYPLLTVASSITMEKNLSLCSTRIPLRIEKYGGSAGSKIFLHKMLHFLEFILLNAVCIPRIS